MPAVGFSIPAIIFSSVDSRMILFLSPMTFQYHFLKMLGDNDGFHCSDFRVAIRSFLFLTIRPKTRDISPNRDLDYPAVAM